MFVEVDLRLRFMRPCDYLLQMRMFHHLLLLIAWFSLLMTAVSAQVIDIGDAVRQGEGRLGIAVDSTDAALAKLARRAFALHGGYTVTTAAKSAYTHYSLWSACAGTVAPRGAGTRLAKRHPSRLRSGG
jgi:hypothetical protein